MIGYSSRHVALMAAAMMINTSAAVGVRRKNVNTIGSAFVGVGETVTFTTPATPTTAPTPQETQMFDRPHREPIHPTTAMSLHRERQAAPKISAAQAKRDRKAAKRAAMVSASETSEQRQESADV